MKILCDTRDKIDAVRGILNYFDRHGIEWERRALKTGDYMLEGQDNLVIDRKGGLGELCVNLCSADVSRFYREIRRAHDDGVRLVILCEQYGVKTFRDIAGWKNPYGKVTGRMLQEKVYQLEMAYRVPVLFCDKRSTGRRIVEILTGQGENA